MIVYYHAKSGRTMELGEHEHVKAKILEQAGWVRTEENTQSDGDDGEAQSDEMGQGGDETTLDPANVAPKPTDEVEPTQPAKRSRK